MEEVSGLISRAVLLRGGQVVGDVSAMELDEQGIRILDYVKQTYHYQPDRVSKALSDLTDGA